MQMSLGNVFAIVFTGLVIVFCGLILLIVCVSIISAIIKSRSGQKSDSTSSAPAAKAVPVKVSQSATPKMEVDDGISDEVVAVIAAAIASMSTGSEGTTFAIRGIKKSNAGRPVWAMAGLQENTRAF